MMMFVCPQVIWSREMDVFPEIQLKFPPTSTHSVIECGIQDDVKSLKKLLRDNDINERFPCITPLQGDGIFDRDDVMKELLSAGAPVNLIPVTEPEDVSFNHERAVSIFTSAGITPVPEDIVASADMTLKNKLKEVVRRLEDHLSKLNWESEGAKKKKKKPEKAQDPNDEVCIASTDPAVPAEASGTHNWLPISKRWRGKLERLVHCLKTDESKVTRIGSIAYINDVDGYIARGSVAEVFLGLRESDGREIAIKRISKTNNQELKYEEALLRHPKLDDSCVVKCVDFAKDKNAAYLCLELCEYNLEEYIRSNDGSLRPEELVYDVLDSLRALHCQEPQILHGDLKPQNVLIGE